MAIQDVIADFEQKCDYLKSTVTNIEDYPIKGILFRDITTLCEDAKAFNLVTDMFYEYFRDKKIDKVVSSEARGFVFGAPLAHRLGAGFVMVRKPKKLPRRVISETYDLEYGHSELSVHEDSIKPGERVLVIDDLLATGGTTIAMCKLVQRLQGEIVNAAFVINLFDLNGAEKLKKECGVDSVSIIDFPGH